MMLTETLNITLTKGIPLIVCLRSDKGHKLPPNVTDMLDIIGEVDFLHSWHHMNIIMSCRTRALLWRV